VARLVTPMMAAWLIRPDHREHREGVLTARYLGLVEWCLRHRFATMAAGTAFFFASLALIPLLPTGFIPPGDQGTGSFNIQIPSPPGSIYNYYGAVGQLNVTPNVHIEREPKQHCCWARILPRFSRHMI